MTDTKSGKTLTLKKKAPKAAAAPQAGKTTRPGRSAASGADVPGAVASGAAAPDAAAPRIRSGARARRAALMAKDRDKQAQLRQAEALAARPATEAPAPSASTRRRPASPAQAAGPQAGMRAARPQPGDRSQAGQTRSRPAPHASESPADAPPDQGSMVLRA